jgi:hypothetical protein
MRSSEREGEGLGCFDWRARSNRLVWAIVALLMAGHAYGQGRGPGGRGAPPPTAKASAPIDLTGYWVSIVTEDWRYRMVTPAKGDYQSLPMTMESRKVADAWDPAKDEAAGEQCKSYGAAGIMRIPERLHVIWQDDETLQRDIDAGTQTRVFHFGNWKSPGGEATWQGDSVAQWDPPRGGRGGEDPSGSLKVITTHMKAAYLRKNGVPYSANATMTEYYDIVRERSGDLWLILTSIVNDPQYLREPFMISTHYRKQADAAGWDPTPCSARW